jgi:hypothetical protein
MTKFAVRLLTLAICAAALVALPAITTADAATNHGKHAKKHARMVQQAPAARDPYKSPFPSNYDEDFDRKNSGGGGGY